MLFTHKKVQIRVLACRHSPESDPFGGFYWTKEFICANIFYDEQR